jgi:hypothetical protein
VVNDSYDAIVIGGGMAGVCCAGELSVRGLRPLLIPESKEVGYQFRTMMLGNNRALVQHPTRQVAWGGGWWWNLARDLNVPVQVHPSFEGCLATVRGSGVFHEIKRCVSATQIFDAVASFTPIPIEDSRDLFEKVLHAGLTIPPQELVTMHQIPLLQWLEDQGADDFVKMVLMSLAANIVEVKLEEATAHLSAFAFLTILRSLLCGEGEAVAIYPDAREGLLIPLAKAVERRGGAVYRGHKVSQVVIENDRVRGVVMDDGTEFRAPHVALAGNYTRVGTLLDPLPPEAVAPLDYNKHFSGHREYLLVTLLDQPVDKNPHTYCAVFDPMDGSHVGLSWSIQDRAPWTVEPGRYLLAIEATRSEKDVAEMGGTEAVFDFLRELSEEMFPGYSSATVDSMTTDHPTWMTPLTIGPKLSHASESVKGLWFVGEGSVPLGGVYSDGAASVGIIGAREIIASHSA